MYGNDYAALSKAHGGTKKLDEAVRRMIRREWTSKTMRPDSKGGYSIAEARNIKLASRPVLPGPPSRGLTSGEIDMVREYFGLEVNPGWVRIISERAWIGQGQHTATAPGGNIYLPPGHWASSADFSKASVAKQGLFLHEMAHVWQVQQGQDIVSQVSWDALRGKNHYAYTLEPGKSFGDYGVEQQAQIVQDYHHARNNEPVTAYSVSDYEQLLGR